MDLIKIYTLSSSRNEEEYRYVGQTEKPLEERLAGHIKSSRREKNYRANWIKKEISDGYKIIISQIDEATLDNWAEKEIHYIRLFKSFGAKLVNGTEGGEAPMRNKKHTLETLLKMSKSHKGRIPAMLGKHHSEETKTKIKAARNKQIRKPHSEETKEKLRQATLKQFKETGHPKGMLGKKQSKESIQKMLETRKRNRELKEK